MKFIVIGTVRPNATPEVVASALKAYTAWKPHKDLHLHSALSAVDHNRVFMVAETTNPEAIYESTVTFSACLSFEVVPVQDSQVAAPAALRLLQA